MSIVAFEKIPIKPPHGNVPIMGSYDSVWGFFIFGQTIENQYNENQFYTSRPTFSIYGSFTCDAEGSLDPSIMVNGTPEPTASFARITNRYNALVAQFAEKAKATPPDSPDDWFGENDPRMILLPEPLRDANNRRIYALPTGISIEEGRYGVAIKYQATLAAGVLPPAVLLVNGFPAWMGRINITGQRPIIERTRLISAEGSLIHIMNYERPSVTVTGVLPIPENDGLIGDRARLFAESLLDGYMTIDMHRCVPGGAVVQGLYKNLTVDTPTIDIRPAERGMSFSVRGLI